MIRTLSILLLTAIATMGQVISRQQLTNYAVAMSSGNATNLNVDGPLKWVAYGVSVQGGTGIYGRGIAVLDDVLGTAPFQWYENFGTFVGWPGYATLINGEWIKISALQITNSGPTYMLDGLYDSFGRSYVTTLQASNSVQVVAGAGTLVTSSGSGGVQTFTVTSTVGAGATNAVNVITTNAVAVGIGLQTLALTNTPTISVSAVSNSLLAQIGFSLSDSYLSGMTSLINLTAGTLGTNATNYVNSRAVANSNLSYTIGTEGTNYANSRAVAASNLSYAIGTAGSNYTDSRAVNLTNAIGALGTALTNNLNTKADASTALSQLSASGITFPGSQPVVSNLNQMIWNVQFTPIPTNSSQSNLTVNLRTNKYFVTLTNNLTLTNFTGLSSAVGYDVTMIVVPQLINRTVVYPTLGAAGYSVRSYTNSNSQMWTTLTNGSAYAISISGFGTNLFWAITEWK